MRKTICDNCGAEMTNKPRPVAINGINTKSGILLPYREFDFCCQKCSVAWLVIHVIPSEFLSEAINNPPAK